MQTLTNLRRRQGLRQKDVARRAGRSQSWVSRMEQSADPRLSQLADYIKALGAQLDVTIRLPDGEAVSAQI